MNTVIKGSIGLAVVVILFSAVFMIAGLVNPIASLIFIVVAIGLNVGAIYWVLTRTAAENGYGMQLVNASLVGLIAGALIFGASLLMLTTIFPDHLDAAIQAGIEWIESSSASEQMKQKQVEGLEGKTPMGESMGGLIGTFFTSLVVGAIVAIFKRRK